MDFHEGGIANVQGVICRIDVHDGLIRRAVIEPGDGMGRHESTCGSQCQEGKRAESRQIDPVGPRSEIRDDVEPGRVGICCRQKNETVVSIAACEVVGAISADDGIAPIVAVDRIASRTSIDRVIPVISLDRVIAGPCVDKVTFASAVDGVIAGTRKDYLAVVAASRDGVAAGGPVDEEWPSDMTFFPVAR